MPDAHYVNSKLAEIYDIDSGWSVDRDFYLALAGPPPESILDLGCGTGLICNAYAAQGHHVTGVDPSAAMLAIGRTKHYGSKINWVEAQAQTFESDNRFDLIIMTGHAFQVLLEDADVLDTFETMRKHLKPGGLIVFESRNPIIDWSKQWNYEVDLKLPTGSVTESRRFLAMNNDRMTFELRYQFPDQTLISNSELRFLTHDQIAAHLHNSGLSVDKVLGDWNGSYYEPGTSEEMIFMVRSAR